MSIEKDIEAANAANQILEAATLLSEKEMLAMIAFNLRRIADAHEGMLVQYSKATDIMEKNLKIQQETHEYFLQQRKLQEAYMRNASVSQTPGGMN